MALPTLQMTRRGGTLVPLDPWSAERLEAYKEGAELNIRITKTTRKGKQSLYFAGLGVMVENLSDGDRQKWPTTTALHRMILVELGYTHVVHRIDGSMFLEPDSVAFDEMEDIDFEAFFELARQFVVDFWLYDPWSVWIDRKDQERVAHGGWQAA